MSLIASMIPAIAAPAVPARRRPASIAALRRAAAASSAMIAATSMGLSIDSSIHYITSFRRERAAGRSVDAALESVQKTVGIALVFAGVVMLSWPSSPRITISPTRWPSRRPSYRP